MIRVFIKKRPNLLHINTENLSQLEFQTKVITREVAANRPTDHEYDEIRPNQSMITEEIVAQKLQQKNSAGEQYQTQTSSVILNPNLSINETTEAMPPSKFTETSFPASSTLVASIATPLQVPLNTV